MQYDLERGKKTPNAGRNLPLRLAVATAAATALTSAGGLLARVLPIEHVPMSGLVAALTDMQGTTALCLLAISTSVIAIARSARSARRRSGLVLALCLFSACIGTAIAAEYLGKVDLGIDHWFNPSPSDSGTRYPGRMGFPAAIVVILTSISLMILSQEHGATVRRFGFCAATGALLLPYVSSLVLLHDPTSSGYLLQEVGSISLVSSTALLTMGISVLALHAARQGTTWRQATAPVGTRFMAGVVVLAALFPALMAWLRLLVSELAGMGIGAGALWVVGISVALFLVAGALGARWIGRYESRWLEPDQLAKLFTPFNRLGQERSKIEGTGIGLVLSKHLVEGMGGRILVSSSAGVGSRFSVVLQLWSGPVSGFADITRSASHGRS
ncbi:ATP-binding protein [Aquabacterium sp. A7-Y]|uniref:ATP-binding protein n=1 Tax=Aquabacterium sp. A7-Y TaxID=1349605 RepID=UPI002AC83CBF|nr:ATP-binding protein [Aquabacterium sp. A7-Y]